MSRETEIVDYLSAKAIDKKIPLHGVFELSPCCNLQCKMCYVRKSRKEVDEAGGELSPEQWIDLAKAYQKQGLLFILITGGEPFLYKGFWKVYEELHKMGMVISINTNGTLINEEVVERLKKIPPNRINITLYGSSREAYERLCGNPDGYDAAIHAAELLKDAGISFRFNASVTSDNAADQETIRQIGEKFGVYVMYATYFFPPIRRGADHRRLADRPSPEESALYESKIRLEGKTSEEIQQIAGYIHEQKLTEINWEKSCLGEGEEGVRCRAGRCSFWINWKGEMLTCGFMNNPTAYPFKQGYMEAWEQLLEETAAIRMPKQCIQCEARDFCDVCPAACMAETGGFEKAPEYLCKRTRKLLEVLKEQYENTD